MTIQHTAPVASERRPAWAILRCARLHHPGRLIPLLAILGLLSPSAARSSGDWPTAVRALLTPPQNWSFITRAHLGGTSEGSDPAGYKVYSAVAIEVAACRVLASHLTAEANLSLESREVEFSEGDSKTNLGSIEALPLTMLIQWRHRSRGTVLPYVGAGINGTYFWERSGRLDSHDLSPTIGPAVQLGADFVLSPSMFLNADFRWNSSETDVEAKGKHYATLRIHPASLGLGVGFRF
jgi:outer membrane protein